MFDVSLPVIYWPNQGVGGGQRRRKISCLTFRWPAEGIGASSPVVETLPRQMDLLLSNFLNIFFARFLFFILPLYFLRILLYPIKWHSKKCRESNPRRKTPLLIDIRHHHPPFGVRSVSHSFPLYWISHRNTVWIIGTSQIKVISRTAYKIYLILSLTLSLSFLSFFLCFPCPLSLLLSLTIENSGLHAESPTHTTLIVLHSRFYYILILRYVIFLCTHFVLFFFFNFPSCFLFYFIFICVCAFLVSAGLPPFVFRYFDHLNLSALLFA